MPLLAVIGNPIAHSRSPEIHEAFARQFKIDLQYERVRSETDQFPDAVRRLVQRGARGFNVTVPFKTAAFDLVGQHTRAAQACHAVNTVAVSEDGQLLGDSTDGAGLMTDLGHNLGWQLTGKRWLVLGAGGAVQSVLPAILASGPACVHLCNRTLSRAEALAARHAAVVARPEDALEACYDVVVNGTSAGLSGQALPVPARVVGHSSCCYDMVYAREQTPFLKFCAEAGSPNLSDGLGMLVEQAALAFRVWFGKLPDTAPVITSMRQPA